MKKKPPTIEGFLLDKIDELIEKLVTSETNRRQAEMNFDIMKDTIQTISTRPINIGLNEDQVNRIIEGVSKVVLESIQKPVIH
jgi:hypothetical protein